MPEALLNLAGDCIDTYEDADETRQERSNMLTIFNPDDC